MSDDRSATARPGHDESGRAETAHVPSRWKWVALTILMGVISGLAAALFNSAVQWATAVLLGRLVGHEPATTAGDGVVHTTGGLGHPWALPLVTVGSALVASLIVGWLAPETGGHGTDAAIAAAHEEPTGVRSRVPVVRAVTATTMLGSGGSGGTEGPIAQIGGALGSLLSRHARLGARQARTLVMTGLGAGVGAIFRAPLSGGVLAAELLYRRGMAVTVLLPAALASGIAFGVFGAFHGYGSLFGDLRVKVTTSPRDLLVYVLLGLVCGVVGRLFCRCFYWVDALTERSIRRSPGQRGVPRWVPPVLGGAAVGFLGMAVPEVLGTGYGTIQELLSTDFVRQVPLWLLLMLPLAKIAATSLSIGTGGSGGIFGPGLLIGAATGIAFWLVASPLGIASDDPVVFAIIGMAVCLGSIVHAPLGVTILVLESTRSPGLLLPIAVAMTAAWWVVGDQTLYRSQLADGEFRITDPLRALWRAMARLWAGRRGQRTIEGATEVVPADAAATGWQAD